MATQNNGRNEKDGIVITDDLSSMGREVSFSIDQDRNLRVRFISGNGECGLNEEDTTFVMGFSDVSRILATLRGVIEGCRFVLGAPGNEEKSFRVDHTIDGNYLFMLSGPKGPMQFNVSSIDGFGLAVALEGAMPHIAFGI